MSRNNKAFAVALLAVVVFGAAWFGLSWGWWGDHIIEPESETTLADAGQVSGGVVQDDTGRRVLYWYDPMLPQHRFERPGKSPFMDMQLVPKYADETGGGVAISPQIQQSLGIRTAPAILESHSETLRAVGEIKLNERLIEIVQNRVNGFIEKLLVRAEGDPVKRGQKLAEVYAPDLLAAQEELLALNNLQDLQGIEQLRQAARKRLRLLGMTDHDVREIERTGKATVRVGVYAPRDGIVQRLGVREGSAVQPGDTLFEVADLSRVWLNLEVPERQLGRLEATQQVEVTVPAYPGKTFVGKVDYIYPTVNTATRTVPVRVVLDNEAAKLMPGMYAEASIVGGEREGLWVPSQAVIQTGERSLVIVQGEQGFRPAAVKVGQQRDDRTEILQGLNEGEQVVVSGQFLIDSEAALSGVLARLNPPQQDAQASGLHQGEGVVEDYDLSTGTVTLSHGPIPSLAWPGMTMPFKLRDPRMLLGVEPGARVTFHMRGEAEEGQYLIERMKIVGGAP